MKNETRTAVYHRRLGVEAYRLAGVPRPFPEHFHRYYVIGVVEAGQRTMRCKGRDYTVQPGDILLFGPGDGHACALMEERLEERLSLDRLCREAGLSRSALLRAFVRSKGITPYRYLENLRVDRARQLLERGVPPAEAALATGFSDQSHFTNCFSRFIGLSPGAYREIFLDKEDG